MLTTFHLTKLFLVALILIPIKFWAQSENHNPKNTKKFTISGITKDNATGETLPYANILAEETNIITVSNQYGFYSITLPEGKCTLVIKYMGYNDLRISINLFNDLRQELSLSAKNQEIQEVIVETSKNDIRSIEQRMSKIDATTVKQLPSLGGEADVMRTIRLLPGVNSVAEIGGITVRGGAYDQNLLLLDEATVYNSEHLVGLYSTFNPNIIKDIKFYKSGIPANYGGRISSVMEITQKEGNMKSLQVNGGLGLIASNITIEGPIIKDKSSFIIGARRSYIDLFFKYIPNDDIKDVKTYFYDINAKANLIINPNNRVYFSCYMGKDLTGLESYESEYGNITATLRYNHIFSNKLFSNTSLIYSKYKMADGGSGNQWGWKNHVGLDHIEFKESFSYFVENHNLELGAKAIKYVFHTGDLQPVGDSSKTFKMKMPQENALESAIYITDNFKVSNNIELQYGLYFSKYFFIGPFDVFKYSFDTPKDPSTITDTLVYKKNDLIKSDHSLEPRISIKFNINTNHSLKIAYNSMAQYIQQVSNTIFPLPYNMWKAANTNLKPLTGNQYSIAYFADFKDNSLEFSCELYYKSLKNIIDVKPGTDISLNKTLDAGLLQGIGRAYGCEFMVNKTKGNLSGMWSYSWSKTEKKISGKFMEETINFGKYYPSDYDIPHKITLTSEYKISKRFSLTAGFTYQTGRPITLPEGQYIYFSTVLPYYPEKNMQRLPDFHRLDIGAILKGKQKASKKWEDNWTFSIYNVYGHKNTISLYIRQKSDSKDTELVKLWAFSVFPSISYNFKF